MENRKNYLPNFLLESSPCRGARNVVGGEQYVHQHQSPVSKYLNYPQSSKSNKTIKFAPQTFDKSGPAYPKTPPSSYFMRNKPPVKDSKEEVFNSFDSYTNLSSNGSLINKNNTQQNADDSFGGDMRIYNQIVYNPKNISYNDHMNYSQKNNSFATSQIMDNNRNFDNTGFYDNLDEYWVRVFGFPSTLTNVIISMFAEYGDIVDYKFATECGNWIDLRYKTKLQAVQTLRQNAKFIKPGVNEPLIIGVCPIKQGGNFNNNDLNATSQNTLNLNVTGYTDVHHNYSGMTNTKIRNIINNSSRNQAKLALQKSIEKRKILLPEHADEDYFAIVPYILSYIPGSQFIYKFLNYIF